MLRFRVDETLFVFPQLTRSGSNPLRSTKIAAKHLSDSRMKQLQWFSSGEE
jgi:hypothetical protein